MRGQNLLLCKNFFCYTNVSIVYGPYFRGGGQTGSWGRPLPPVEKSKTKLIQSSPQSETLIESSFSDFDY